MDGVLQHLDEEVHVVASPIVAVGDAVAVCLVGLLVGNLHACGRIGVEIVIDVKAVHVIAAHDVGGDGADVGSVFVHTGVKEIEPVILKETLGVFGILVRHCQLLCAFCLGSKGIDPCVEFHTSLVTLLNHPLQGIPVGIRGRALSPGEEATPRFFFRGIERIAFDSDLKDDGVDATALEFVKLIPQILLHDITAHTEELSVDGLNPSASELTFGLIVHLLEVGGLCRKKEKEGRKEESGKRCLDAGACRRKNMFHRLQGTFKNERRSSPFRRTPPPNSVWNGSKDKVFLRKASLSKRKTLPLPYLTNRRVLF